MVSTCGYEHNTKLFSAASKKCQDNKMFDMVQHTVTIYG
jgi:hypothetical protein